MSIVINLLNKIFIVFGVIGVFIVVIMISGANPSKDQGLKNQGDGKISAVRLPEQLSFAGERVPLENFDVKESLDKELLVNTYWHSQTLLMIKRANRYFPVIEPILKKNGIPDDFKFLALAESGFTNATSPAGACGFWQFVKPTAIGYGMEVNNEVDERYNLEKATEAACKYIRQSYDIYKNWTMAAASYNVGLGGLNKQITRQYSTNYYDIMLNDETARYIFRITSLKAIIENPQDFGFSITKGDMYLPFQYEEMSVNTPIKDLAQFAFQNGTNYKMVKILNPWLRENYLTNKNKKIYKIKIPTKGMRNIIARTEQSDIDSIIARSARLTL
jgi:membrane-bound lytic murein transglycosylase D